MKRISFLFIFALTLVSLTSCVSNSQEKRAKYVFYFIGDGMGLAHVSSTQAYLSYVNSGKIGREPLSFTQFPVVGTASTYSASNDITCSSAAGTALSTGYKTNNHFLGVAPDSSKLVSISYKIKEAGFPVGIMSTVSIDHATPASFYANSVSRSDYYSISTQLPASNFDFFAGGGFIQPTGKERDKKSIYELIEEGGYVIAAGLDEYSAKKSNAQKMLLLQNSGRESGDFPYVIDKQESDMSLSDLIKSAIDFLDKGDGFFIMAEAGKIDWAAHANDAKSTFLEVKDLSDAVAVAYEFYLQHPDETLIVVTADHETGGLSIGEEKGYKTFYDKFEAQVASKDKSVTAATYEHEVETNIVDQINDDANIGWTTTSHTGANVPVFAAGVNSSLFGGWYDNTDIPKRICEAMGIKF